MIRIENLCLNYGKQVVFNNQSLSIPDGSLVMVTGESGCGKTTLLKCIYGLNRNYQGIVDVAGAKMSFVNQQCTLANSLTCRQNLCLVAGADMKKAEELTEVLELGQQMDKYPGECSLGQRQKMMVLRCLISNADIILADEPFSHLDLAGMKTVGNLLIDQKQLGKTVIVASHEDSLCKRADLSVLIKNGCIEIAELQSNYC